MCEGFNDFIRLRETEWKGSVNISKPSRMRPSTARSSRGLAPWPSMVLSTRYISKLLQTIELSVEGPNIDVAVHDGGRGVDVFANLKFGNEFSIVSS